MNGITQAQFNSMVDNDIIDKSQEEQIKLALKLQELVKAQIIYESELNEGFNDYEKTALFLLETLVEESEK